jgi:hypothetical protein
MSATTFAGSAHFAAASILGGNGSALAAIAAAGLLNARYAPISISVARLFHGPRLRRLAESQLIVDESWALAGRGGRFDRRILVGAGLLLYVAWVSGTAVGVVAGDALGDPTSQNGAHRRPLVLVVGVATVALRPPGRCCSADVSSRTRSRASAREPPRSRSARPCPWSSSPPPP